MAPLPVDVEAARRYLRDLLPRGESIELVDPALLDAAAAVIVNGKAKP